MVQTRNGVKKNEWVQFMRVCAEQYRRQKEESKVTQDSKTGQVAGEEVCAEPLREPARSAGSPGDPRLRKS